MDATALDRPMEPLSIASAMDDSDGWYESDSDISFHSDDSLGSSPCVVRLSREVVPKREEKRYEPPPTVHV
jgi:hypothetical protein